eukprot:gene8914-biopygen3378
MYKETHRGQGPRLEFLSPNTVMERSPTDYARGKRRSGMAAAAGGWPSSSAAVAPVAAIAAAPLSTPVLICACVVNTKLVHTHAKAAARRACGRDADKSMLVDIRTALILVILKSGGVGGTPRAAGGPPADVFAKLLK